MYVDGDDEEVKNKLTSQNSSSHAVTARASANPGTGEAGGGGGEDGGEDVEVDMEEVLAKQQEEMMMLLGFGVFNTTKVRPISCLVIVIY